MQPPWRPSLVIALALSLTAFAPALAQAAPAPEPRAALADLDVVGASRLVRGATATFEVRAFLARDWRDRGLVEPAQSPVTARLISALGSTTSSRELALTRDGHALTLTVLRDLPLGRSTLEFEAQTPAGPAIARLRVEVVDAARLLLKTDSALVQPGGRLAWRAALLDTHTRRPLPPTSITASLLDTSGTPRAATTATTDRFGLASGHLIIPAALRSGRYRLQLKASGGDLVATQDLEVRPFEPQAFFVSVSETSDPERRVARFEVSARHADGTPMSRAKVALSDERGDPIGTGLTDTDGRFQLESAATSVSATVTDPRGERVTALHHRSDPPTVELELLTAGATPIAGEHFTFQVATHQRGRPIPTTLSIELRVGGQATSSQTVTTDSSGLAPATVFLAPRPTITSRRTTALALSTDHPELRAALERLDVLDCLDRGTLALTLSEAPDPTRWALHARHLPFPERPDFAVALTAKQLDCLELLRILPPRTPASPRGELRANISIFETIATRQDELDFELVATSADGLASTRLERTTTPSIEAPLWLTPLVPAAGEVLAVEVPGSDPARESLVLVLDDGLVVAVAPLSAGRASIEVPKTATGLLTVEILTFDRESDGRIGASLTGQVFARPRPLSVAIAHPPSARPGATVPLTVSVTDGAKPVEARLFASVLDERLLALSPEVAATPPIATWLSQDATRPLMLDEHAARFAELIRVPDPSPSEHALMQALVATVPLPITSTELILPAAIREHAERGRLEGLRPDLVALAVRRADLALASDSPPLAILLSTPAIAKSLSDPSRPAHLDPWGRPHTWENARKIAREFDAATFGKEVTALRLDLVVSRLGGKTTPAARELSSLIAAPRHLTHDAWGRPLLVTSRGRDLLVTSAGPDGEHGTADDLELSRDETLARRMLTQGVGGLGFVGYGAGGGGSAHHRASLRTADAEQLASVRERFDTNVLWESVTTDASGHHRFEVPLSDSTTTWRVDVEAMTDDGRFGHARSQLQASLPLSIDLRLPDALVIGDRFEARALAVNTTSSPRDLTLGVTADGLTLGVIDPRLHLEAGASKAIALPLLAARPGRAQVQLTLTDSSGAIVDSMIKHLDVQDIGIERRISRRVRLDGRTPAGLDTSILADAGGAREVRATVVAQRGAPDLALSSLAALLRTPTGCFEQTTARSWPNLLVLRLLPKDSALFAKARELALSGYERIKTFEVHNRGFALYPGDQPATILTAIGLVQLVDAAGVIEVERDLLERVATALVARQNPEGRFRVDAGWYGSQDALAVTAYAAWALSEALGADARSTEARLFSAQTSRAITRALQRARRVLSRSRPESGRLAAYVDVLARLAGATPTPSLRGAPGGDVATIYASGASAGVELAGLELLDATRRSLDGQRHLDVLMGARNEGGWPTTQATIHALRALAELDTGTPSGAIELSLAGQALEPLPLEGESLPTRGLPLSPTLAGSDQRLTLSSTSPVLVELELIWRESDAPARQSAGLTVHLEAPLRPIRVGQTATLTVGIHNPGEELVTLPTAVLEIPPGFTLDVAALRSLARAGGHLDHIEVFGRRVELYFDALPSGGAALVPLTVTADHVAEVTMRPAEAFAYYDPQLRGRSDQLRLTATD